MYEMRRRKLSLHFTDWLKGYLTSHTIYVWYERNWPLIMLYELNVIAVTRIRTSIPRVTYPHANHLSYLPTLSYSSGGDLKWQVIALAARYSSGAAL